MILQVKDVTQIYQNKNHNIKALDKVSYSFREGNIYGIVGMNGAGKTTLIKTISGLLIPTEGNVYFDGSPLFPTGFYHLSKIGAILEGSRNIFWNFTPLQNVKYFAFLRGLSLKKVMPVAINYFEKLNLVDKVNTPVRNLSQGMKQKIAIVISLLHEPHILLLDEPTLGLDPIASEHMQGTIKRVAKEEGKIVIITSHQLNILENICDEIIFLQKGRVVFIDSVENIKKSKENIKFKIYVKTFGQFNPSLNYDMPINLIEYGDKVIFELSQDEHELNKFIKWATSKNFEIVDIEKISLSLEDIFKRHMLL